MPGEVVLQTPRAGWLRFRAPREIVTAASPAEVVARLRYIEDRVQAQGWYAAGFLTYEAAPAFDAAQRVKPPASTAVPLMWFGLYERVESIELPGEVDRPDRDRAACSIGPWTPSVAWPDYERAIHTIRQHIAAGETYQVNYTYRLRAPFAGEAWPFFLSLAQKQPVGYAAYLDIGTHAICSARSPFRNLRRAGVA